LFVDLPIFLEHEGVQKGTREFARAVTAEHDQLAALWTVWPRDATEHLRAFRCWLIEYWPYVVNILKKTKRADTVLSRQPPAAGDDSSMYLCGQLRELMRERMPLSPPPAVFVQLVGDAVFIPAGCAYQMHALADIVQVRVCARVACSSVTAGGTAVHIARTPELRAAKHYRRASCAFTTNNLLGTQTSRCRYEFITTL
jgi:hypothetical protein